MDGWLVRWMDGWMDVIFDMYVHVRYERTNLIIYYLSLFQGVSNKAPKYTYVRMYMYVLF